MRKLLIFPLLISSNLFSLDVTEDSSLAKVTAAITLEDYPLALEVSEKAFLDNPNSEKIKQQYIISLIYNGFNNKAVELMQQIAPQTSSSYHSFIEQASWALLAKSSTSSQAFIRMGALMGASITNDARGVQLVSKMIEDANASVRQLAVQLAMQHHDYKLEKKILERLPVETNWQVRLELIRAVGVFQIKEMEPYLQNLATDPKASYEEKFIAIESLMSLYEDVSFADICALLHSEKGMLRQIGCQAAAFFQQKLATQKVIQLLSDPIVDVRFSALCAMIIYFHNHTSIKELAPTLATMENDSDYRVAVLSSFLSILLGQSEKTQNIQKYLNDPNIHVRCFAARALSSLGKEFEKQILEALEKSSDPFVQINLSLGLIEKRISLEKSATYLRFFLQKNENQIMLMQTPVHFFSYIAPTEVRHTSLAPNYPQAVDQATRLQLLSYLAMISDPCAEEMIKEFLQKKHWEITGYAASLLVHEGKEETIDLLRSFLKQKDPDLALSAAFVLAFVAKDPEALSILKENYPHADREKKVIILEAMGRLAGMDSLSFFLQTLLEPFELLRIIDASSLIQTLQR